MPRLLPILAFLFASVAHAAIVDRIAAVVDEQVITVSEVGQMAGLRFYPRPAKASDDQYRHYVLDELIDQALRFRDVERFGATDIAKEPIDARLREIAARFPSSAAFDAALGRSDMTLDELRTLVRRQLQVEAYIQERFSPTVFIATEEVEAHYRGPWSGRSRAAGLAIPPLSSVDEEIRGELKSAQLAQEVQQWTTELRARADVDVLAWK
ncbi:MAG TPA: hypothetical protein VEZ11_13345 [Thermoanaerobaculia bacterium]|nr:hypothetical protein [Thermoanaerobaculia bacterium]